MNAQAVAPVAEPVTAGPGPEAVVSGGVIGPNSVLQLVPLLDESLGRQERDLMLRMCGLSGIPSDEGLMPEAPAARLHQLLRERHPRRARELARQAGMRTGDYILRYRIPPIALRLLRSVPPWLSGPLLANTIEKHAWTFAGSGSFRVVGRQPLTFELKDNPMVRGEQAGTTLCVWHEAVFERLYTHIVDHQLTCEETHCCARGDGVCRFVIRPTWDPELS